jgi:hypothetical protein
MEPSPSVSLPCLMHRQGREPSLKRKAQYNRPPCNNLFISAAFDNARIICFKK